MTSSDTHPGFSFTTRTRLGLMGLLALSCMASRVEALPIFGAPGYSLAAGGYRYPATYYGEGNPTIWKGVAISQANITANGVTHKGMIRWDVNGNAQELFELGAGTTGYREYRSAGVTPNGSALGGMDKYNAGGQYLGFRAIAWQPFSSMPHEMLTPWMDGIQSSVLDVNGNGISVGWVGNRSGSSVPGQAALLWNDPFGMATVLPPLSTSPSGASTSMAWDISASGYITGKSVRLSASGAFLEQHVVRWSNFGASIEALNRPTSLVGQNITIDRSFVAEDGTCVANIFGAIGRNYAARWKPGTNEAENLLPLSEDPSGTYQMLSVTALSPGGVAVGKSQRFAGTGVGNEYGNRAVRWNDNDVNPIELQTLGIDPNGSGSSVAYSINSSDVIVGSSTRLNDGGTSTSGVAVYWTKDNLATDLNDLVNDARWTLKTAYAIDNAGFIVGSGTYDQDLGGPLLAYDRAFILLVPEAGTYGQGDANFDGAVNFDDLLLLAQHYGEANASGSANVADFDLDGTTDFDDLLTLAQHYQGAAGIAGSTGIAGSDAFRADWRLAESLVPEPIAMTGLAIAFVGRRRGTKNVTAGSRGSRP